jgi:ubiquinone/menaquinone biosynthesis C-methylase UbiE
MARHVTGARADSTADEWSQWLLHRRHGDDAAFAGAVRAEVERYADRVLDAARLAPGMTLADIGAGDGLVAFRAIERIGPSLRVLLTDVSATMLQHAQSLAVERGVRGQCEFLHCPADALTDIPGASADVVTTRAVLAYVADKLAALREFYRVLKPGGLISLSEPIFQDDAFAASALRTMIDAQSEHTRDLFTRLLHRWKAAQYPDTSEKIAASPLVNFSERTLFEFVRQCGFVDIHLELHIDMAPSIIGSWEVFLTTSPHPWAPALSSIMSDQFTAAERQLFERTMRPIIESSNAKTITRMVYLTAAKPPVDHA